VIFKKIKKQRNRGMRVELEICIYLLLTCLPYVCVYYLSVFFANHNQPPLFDIIHHLTKTWPQKTFPMQRKLKDDLLITLYSMCISFAILNRQLFIIFYYFKLIVILNLVRIPFFMSTILPLCQSRKIIKSPFDIRFGSNFDFMFSGHVSTFLVVSFVLEYEFELTIFHGFWFVLSIFYAIWIVILRDHYTIDVLVAFAITIPSVIYWYP
jgi:hypothetical protein